MSKTVNTHFTEEEKRLLLKIFRVNLPKDVTSEKIDEMFYRLQTKLQKAHESDSDDSRGVDFSELANITLELTPSKNSQAPSILPKDSKELIQSLKKALNEIPWTSIALETAKCVVIGSSPQSLAIAVGLELLMRIRFGNLFRGGAAAIQIVLTNLNKIDPRELAEEAAKDAAAAVMTAVKVFGNFINIPKDAVLKIEGTASKFFSAFTKELTAFGKRLGLHVEALEHSKSLEAEQQKKTAPTPFHMSPIPTKVGA